MFFGVKRREKVMSRESGGGSSSRSTSPYGSKTKLKYEKSSCYFCNEWLDSESFKVCFLVENNLKVFCFLSKFVDKV